MKDRDAREREIGGSSYRRWLVVLIAIVGAATHVTTAAHGGRVSRELGTIGSPTHGDKWEDRGAVDAVGKAAASDVAPVHLAALQDEDKRARKAAADALGKSGSPDAVPALLAMLGDSDQYVRKSAARALGKIGSPDGGPALIAALHDPVMDVREAAAEALGELELLEGVPALIEAQRNDAGPAREAAIKALGEIASPASVAALIVTVTDRGTAARRSAAAALGQTLSPEGVPALISALADSDGDVRSNAARGLMILAPPEASASLLVALKDREVDVRRSAATALGRIGSSAFVPALISAMKDSDDFVRGNGAEALGTIGSIDTLPALIAAVKDSDSYVRGRAASALGHISSAEAVVALVSTLADPDSTTRLWAGLALGRNKAPETTRLLVAALKDKERDVRAGAAFALGNRRAATEATAALLVAVRDSEVDVRLNAAEALGEVGSPEALSALLLALRDPESDVRGGAAWGLGKLKSNDAVPALISALDDPAYRVRQRSAFALGEIGSPRAVPRLLVALGDPEPNVRRAAARALGKIKATEAVTPLGATLQDSNDEVRSGAAEALGEIGLPEGAPSLVAALKDKDQWVRQDAARSLGQIRSAESTTALLSVLYDKEPRVRRVVKSSLGRTLDASSWTSLPKPVRALLARSGDFVAAALRESPRYGLAMLDIATLCAQQHPAVAIQLLRGLQDLAPLQNSHALVALVNQGESSPRPGTIALATVPYAAVFATQWLLDARQYTDVLRIADAAVARVQPYERALAIVLRWQRSEAMLALSRAQDAESELAIIERELIPRLTRVERRLSSLPFGGYTLYLKGKTLQTLGQPLEAVVALRDAEQTLSVDARRIDPIHYEEEEDGDDMKRVRHLILSTRAQAQWAGAKSDADRAIGLGMQLSLTRPAQFEAQEAALIVRVRAAFGEGDYEKAHSLTEELALLRQRWDERQTITSAAPARRVALVEIERLRQAIAKMELREREARDQSVTSTTGRSQGDSNLRQILQEQREARRELKQFYTSLKKKQPEIAALIGGEPTDLVQVQEHLASDQALIQYLVLEKTSYAFVITRKSIDTKELALGRTGLVPLIRAYRQQLQARPACSVSGREPGREMSCERNSTDPGMGARELARVLLEPLKEKLESIGQLTFVPNGPLHQLPFAALDWDGRPLVHRFIINQFPTATEAAMVMGREDTKTSTLLALAVPRREGWSDLPNAVEEVRAIKRLYPGAEVKVGPEARMELIKGKDLQQRALHFATHGQAGTREQTLLVLADGNLLLADVWGLGLVGSPRVVLSACEASLGEQLSGDEVVSLANGFLFAGTNSVVATLWKVPDGQTRQLMERFYEHLAQQMSTAQALAQAQRDLIDQNYPPYAWAAFTVTGI